MTTEIKRRKYSPEYKKDAVALATEQGYSMATAAQAVDTGENNLRRWEKELEQGVKGERLNVILVGGLADVVSELVRRGFRLQGLNFDRRQQLSGRPPELVLRKKGQAGVLVNWLRIWVAPFSYQTDGLRAVLFLVTRPLSISDVEILYLHPALKLLEAEIVLEEKNAGH